jgi:hypothetical protein
VKAWSLILLAVAVGVVALLLLREDPPPHRQRSGAAASGERRVNATSAEKTARNGSRAGGVDPESRSIERAKPVRKVWYGIVVDRRTGTGEPNAQVRVEGHPSGMTWPAVYTLEGGIFVMPVPKEVPKDDRLRLVVETNDERIGMRAIQVQAQPATDVGLIYLRSREVLAGRCVARGQIPIGKVKLTLRAYGELAPRRNPIAHTTADETGYFEFKSIPRGLYAVNGRGPEGELFVETAVALPRFKPLILRKREAEPIRFTVCNTVGEPVGYANISARLLGPKAYRDPFGEHLVLPAMSAKSDAEGSAETLPALPGEYEVQVFSLNDRFDFVVRASPARLVIPTDPRVLVRFTRNKRPLRKTRVVTNKGGVVTDDDGVAALPRGRPPRFDIDARAGVLAGRATLPHGKILEGQISLTVSLKPEREENAGGPRTPGRQDRRVRVTRPDGKPVKGARILGGSKVARTGEDGWAVVPDASEEGYLKLERTDLASGFPTSEMLGNQVTVEFTWNPGRLVRIKLTDARFGFPVDSNVRIGIRESAWKRVAPGVFEGLWDPETAPEDAKITIKAKGYEPTSLDPPYSPGPPAEHEIAFARPGITATRTMLLQVVKGGTGVPGAFVEARLFGSQWIDTEHRRTVHAITQEDGLVILRNLQPGRWFVQADGGWNGWGRTIAQLDEGGTEVRVELAYGAPITGQVVGPRGRPVENARVEVAGASRIVRTRSDGRFAINLARRVSGYVQFEVTKPGYAKTATTWVRKDGVLQKTPLVLKPLRRVAFPLYWQDGDGDPVPDDLVCKLSSDVESVRVDDALVFDVGGDGHESVIQLHGSAVVAGGFRRLKGRPKPIPLLRGARIEGTVKGAREGTVVSALVRRTRTMVARTDADGRFVIEGVPAGNVRIDCEGQTATSRERNANLKAVDRNVLEVLVEVGIR